MNVSDVYFPVRPLVAMLFVTGWLKIISDCVCCVRYSLNHLLAMHFVGEIMLRHGEERKEAENQRSRELAICEEITKKAMKWKNEGWKEDWKDYRKEAIEWKQDCQSAIGWKSAWNNEEWKSGWKEDCQTTTQWKSEWNSEDWKSGYWKRDDSNTNNHCGGKPGKGHLFPAKEWENLSRQTQELVTKEGNRKKQQRKRARRSRPRSRSTSRPYRAVSQSRSSARH